VTALSAILGFFLLAVDLGFAGMVLIIVNAGAIAVVFLFVCILAKRETIVTRFVPLFFFPCMAAFFFAMTNLSARLLGFLFNSMLDERGIDVNYTNVVKSTLRLSDDSISSHLFLTIFSPQWWPVLLLIGLFLFLVMVVAINVTKT
jgi:NADH:ubiquinone oxidoreductase subunit 6 (subunit J)